MFCLVSLEALPPLGAEVLDFPAGRRRGRRRAPGPPSSGVSAPAFPLVCLHLPGLLQAVLCSLSPPNNQSRLLKTQIRSSFSWLRVLPSYSQNPPVLLTAHQAALRGLHCPAHACFSSSFHCIPPSLVFTASPHSFGAKPS